MNNTWALDRLLNIELWSKIEIFSFFHLNMDYFLANFAVDHYAYLLILFYDLEISRFPLVMCGFCIVKNDIKIWLIEKYNSLLDQ